MAVSWGISAGVKDVWLLGPAAPVDRAALGAGPGVFHLCHGAQMGVPRIQAPGLVRALVWQGV